MRIRGITGKDTGSRQGEMGHVAEQRGLKARVREEVWFQALVAAVASLTKRAKVVKVSQASARKIRAVARS